jgi:hypothetical protein
VLSTSERGGQCRPDRFVAGDRELEIFHDRVLLEHVGFETCARLGFGDLRFCQRQQIGVLAEPSGTGIGPRLAVITSIIVVLPAPFGPMMQRSSPTSMYSVRR